MNVQKLRTVAVFCLLVLSQNTFAASTEPQLSQTSQNGESSVSDSTFNISIHPLEILWGYLSGSIEMGVLKNVTVGPYLSHSGISGSFNNSKASYRTLSVGAISTISLGHPNFTSGWLFQPFVEYSSKLASAGFSAGAFGAGGNFGYQWFWSNRVNLLLGLGLKYTQGDFSIFGSTGTFYMILPSAALQLGYAF